MSNKIDFFQPQQNQLSIPAVPVSILIDGILCPDLEPIEIVRSDWPQFGWAKLIYNPAANTDAEVKTTEDLMHEFSPGKSVSIRQYYNPDLASSAIFNLPVFTGQIESVETKRTPDGETVEIVARDFSTILKRLTVYGQRLAKDNDSSIFIAGFETVFNPNGKGNASQSPIESNGKSYTVFCSESDQSKLWTYAQAIDYLLCEYIPTGQIQKPDLSRLQALTENQIVRDLDVTGLNLSQALHRCCQRIGLMFKFVPHLAETGPDQAIVFYRPGTDRVVELNCQPNGQQISISKTNIAQMHSRKTFWPVTHKYIGQGDFKIYEATFELIKAWDSSLETTDYDKLSPATNPDFYQIKDVYRKWSLNETGRYSIAPYSRGDAFDFSKIFDSSNFVQRHRRFHPSLTTDKLGLSLGYYLEVSFDSGQNWRQYLHAFNILLEECGVWLSSDQLDIETWIAAMRGFLKFRLTASVVSDERLTAVVADGPVNSTAPVIEHVLTMPREFKYHKVSEQSIFAEATDETLGTPDEIDDSDDLYEFIRHTAESSHHIIEKFDIQTPSLMLNYQVGDIVGSCLESRDLLSCRSDSRSTNRITRVHMDFQKQCTNLKIVQQRS